MTDYWKPGETVVRREVTRGRPTLGYAVRVVRDDIDVLATYLAPGSQVAHTSEHPWRAAGRDHAPGHGRLTLYRFGDAYAVDLLWDGPERRFAGWLVNLEEPVKRHAHGFDTRDHHVGFRVQPDGSWKLVGPRTIEEVDPDVRETAKSVRSMLDWRNQWWESSWASWQPPADWGSLELPEDWAGRDVA
ncbi:DUF402 domain-containing protein [Nocardioides campestrisoli]|uniref:DUF402 domain-containing protein n=1 Tax=Nocardioides campestrisoli TaxID=2736757 RepID=UPI0015E703FF|nr:DUF402 domain-containing protein [Nocardioides campestrisoli]